MLSSYGRSYNDVMVVLENGYPIFVTRQNQFKDQNFFGLKHAIHVKQAEFCSWCAT